MNVSIRERGRGEWWSRHWFGIGLTIILVFSAAIRLYQIGGFSGDYDEGVHLMIAWLQAKGFPLYSETVTVQLPLLFQPTAWLFELLGPSSVIARSLEVGYALVGIMAIAWTGRLLWGPTAGLTAALFLSLEMRYFLHSRVFLGTASSAAVGGLAVFCALYYQVTGRRRWLFLAGVVFSFSLLIKPLSLFVGLLLCWAIIVRRWSEVRATAAGRGAGLRSFPWRNILFDFLWLGLAVLILPLLCLAFYDRSAMLSLLVSVQAHRVGTRGGGYVVRILSEYVRYSLPLSLLAALGAIQVIRRRDTVGGGAILWLALSLTLFVASRAQRHHLLIIDLPLALLAARPVGVLGEFAGTWRLRPKLRSGILTILLLTYYLVSLPSLWGIHFSSRPRGLDLPGDSERWASDPLVAEGDDPGAICRQRRPGPGF